MSRPTNTTGDTTPKGNVSEPATWTVPPFSERSSTRNRSDHFGNTGRKILCSTSIVKAAGSRDLFRVANVRMDDRQKVKKEKEKETEKKYENEITERDTHTELVYTHTRV